MSPEGTRGQREYRVDRAVSSHDPVQPNVPHPEVCVRRWKTVIPALIRERAEKKRETDR